MSLGRRYFYTVFAYDEEDNCSGESVSALADVCPNCDIDLMVGISTADVKGLRNEGVLGMPPPVRSLNTDWEMLSAPGGKVRPVLADFDHDGEFDLLLGFSDGRYRSWETTGSRQTGHREPALELMQLPPGAQEGSVSINGFLALNLLEGLYAKVAYA